MTADPSQDPGPASAHGGHVYVRPVAPLVFPTEELVPETNRHLELRTGLYLTLKDHFAKKATLASDQFVYFDPTNPKRCLAPDVFVKLGQPHATFDTWMVWLRGAPELGVEIASRSDEDEDDWDDKLDRYRASGIAEVVRFDHRDRERPLRVWDRVDGDLVERSQDDPRLRECTALGLWWTVVESAELGPTLRLARDPEGRDLLPTYEEARASAEEAARQATEKLRATERKRRDADAKRRDAEAERDELAAKVTALEAQLAAAAPKARQTPRNGKTPPRKRQ